jgi:hypothetical protein
MAISLAHRKGDDLTTIGTQCVHNPRFYCYKNIQFIYLYTAVLPL